MAQSMPSQARQAGAALMVICVGVVAVTLAVWNAELRAPDSEQLLLQMPKNVNAPGFTQELWFGPGIADDLTRMVNLGKEMSPKLSDYLKKGLEAQSKMVHLDQIHQGEVDSASGEADMWSSMGGNNNGGNEPCMKAPGECP